MAMLASAVLQPWIASFENIDWFNFRGHHLNSLRHIHSIPIRPELLHATAQFWDPEFHVFRFGLQELCPTVEEFHAYLETRPNKEPVIPPIRIGFVKILRDKLGVSDGLAKHLIRGSSLDILRLFADFSPRGNPLDYTVQNRRMFALCMCLLATYLLVPSDGNPSPSIVSVAAQIEQRRDVVPMILAETLMGLDAVRSGRTDVFAGSPLLLQMWLCDKMKLVADPANGWVYQARDWRSRRFVEIHHNVEEWLDFFMAVEEEHIVWRCHWLPLPDMTASYMGHSWVILAALTGFTFYFPQRILCQFGIRQEVEFSYPSDFHLPEFKHSVVEAYRRDWGGRVTWVRDQYPSIHLRGRYRQWLRRELETRFGNNVD